MEFFIYSVKSSVVGFCCTGILCLTSIISSVAYSFGDTINIFEPEIVSQSPANEATVVTLSDGAYKIFYINRPGAANCMMSIQSRDGIKWSDPVVEFLLPGEAYYANRVLISKSGVIHCVFHIWSQGEKGYRGRQLDLWHTWKDPGKAWAEPKLIMEGYVGSIRSFIELESGRLLLSFGKAVPERENKPDPGEEDVGWNEVLSMYSDNAGQNWSCSNALTIEIDSEKATRYGAIEPTVVELKPGYLWMLIRTNKGLLYESYSHDSGSQWSEPKPSPFISSDSPAAFLRLSDGRLVLFLNMNQRWDDPNSYAFGGREVLHAAISSDNGITWCGFREIINIYCQSITQQKQGDRGTAYPSPTETDEGKILLVTGQGHSRSIIVFDPDWLEIDNEIRMEACTSDSASTSEVLFHFPTQKSAKITIDFQLPGPIYGFQIALTDHYSVPHDSLAIDNAVINYTWISLNRRKKSHHMTLDWNLDEQRLDVIINGNRMEGRDFLRPSRMGTNYLRLRCVDVEGRPIVPQSWDFIKNYQIKQI